MPAGNLHAYLHGIGVEVMANSPTMCRGGTDAQARRCAGVCAGARLHTRGRRRHPPRNSTGRERNWSTTRPHREFAVSVLNIDGEHLGPRDRPRPPATTGRRSCCAPRGRRGACQDQRRRWIADRPHWVSADDGPIRLVAQQPTTSCSGRPSASSVALSRRPNGSTCHDRDDHGPDDQPDEGRGRGVDQPGQHPADARRAAWCTYSSSVVHEAVGRMPAEACRCPTSRMWPPTQSIATVPIADSADNSLGIARDQAAADLLRESSTSAARGSARCRPSSR